MTDSAAARHRLTFTSTPLVLKLAVRRIGTHPLRVALATLAVAAGVASTASVLVVRASVSESVAEGRGSLAGFADLRVTGHGRRAGLDGDAAHRVSAVNGVRIAAPVVEAVTVVEQTGGAEQAAGPDLHHPTVVVVGADCRLLVAVAQVPDCASALLDAAANRPLAVGPDMPTDGRMRTAEGYAALATAPTVPEFGDRGVGNLVVVSLDAAQRMFGRDQRVDAVYAWADAEVDLDDLQTQLERQLGNGVLVAPASDPPASLRPALGHFLPISGLVAVLALLIGGALVYTTLAISLNENRHATTVIRAVGASRAQLHATHLAEAASVGLLGGLVGALVGTVAARPIVGSLSRAVSDVVNVQLTVHRPAGFWLIGGGIGLGTACLAAVVVMRNAGRPETVPELARRGAEEALHPPLAGLLTWALVAACGLAAVTIAGRPGLSGDWRLPLGLVGFAVLTVALLFGGAESVARASRALFRRGARRRKMRVSTLAMVNLTRSPRRTAAIVTVVAGALVSSFVLSGFVEANRAGTAERTGRAQENLVQVSLPGVDRPDALDVGLEPELVDRLLSLPEVCAAHRRATGTIPGHGDVDVRSVIAGHGCPGSRIAPAGSVLLPHQLAASLGVTLGDRVVVRGPSGSLRLDVRIVGDEGHRDSQPVTIDASSFVAAFGLEPVTTLQLEPPAGTTADELAAAVHGSEQSDSLRALTPGQTAADDSARLYRLLTPYRVLQGWLLLLGLVTMSSALMLAAMQRRREIGLLRAVGLGRWSVGRLVLAEALLVWLLAAVLSTLVGPVLLHAFLTIEELLIGVQDPYRAAWDVFAAYAAIALALAVAAAAGPVINATRVSVIETMRPES